MKDLQTGEITPPLPHDEYQRQFAANVESERREKARAQSAKGRARTAPPRDDDADETDDDGEPTFGGKPLADFEGLSDEEILEIDGIGEGTLRKIRAAQKK